MERRRRLAATRGLLAVVVDVTLALGAGSNPRSCYCNRDPDGPGQAPPLVA
jgi:hypothetical protein